MDFNKEQEADQHRANSASAMHLVAQLNGYFT